MAFRRWVLALVVLAGACGDEPRRRPPVGGDGGLDAGVVLRDASFPDVPSVDGGVCMDVVDVVFVLSWPHPIARADLDLVEEIGDGRMFPHIYGPIPLGAVRSAVPVPKRSDGTLDLSEVLPHS